jgi:Replication-relaxation
MPVSARGVGGAEADRLARKVADLAGRLTERDRQLCRLLAEHRVFTSHQITDLAFNHLDTAEDRLRALTALGVLDRFRPRRDTGSAPYHYVLGPIGAAMLAAE